MQINLVISQLPRVAGSSGYLCVFNNEHVTRARVIGGGLRCDPPPPDRRPTIAPFQGTCPNSFVRFSLQ